ncbi:MAG: Ig-like domain-containing protein, partial [Bifidobacteriaceae bacterium]|nr:Ig-like domain-containing protein [Bifidobacteriaceae bacterium]
MRDAQVPNSHRRAWKRTGAHRRPAAGGGARGLRAPLKAVAFAAAAAVGLAGTVMVGALVEAPEAQAVDLLNSWDGVFKKDQLWYRGTSDDQTFSVTDPGKISDVGANLLGRFRPGGTKNGTAGSSGATIALGPVFKWAGDQSLQMVDIGYLGPHDVFQMANGKINGIQYGNVRSSTVTNGAEKDACQSTSERFSGEVNQQNGYLYEVAAGSAKTFSGTLTSWSVDAAIYRLGRPNTADTKITCVAGVTSIASAGGSLNDQWKAQTGESYTATWNLASDMAIDANGNFYLLLRGNAKHHALVRLEISKNAANEPTSSGWKFRLVKAFTGEAGNYNKFGMAFADGALYTVDSVEAMHRWDPVGGTVTAVGKAPSAGNNSRDLASAQAAPVIEGRVYNDANGNGVIDAGEGGVANATVEIYNGSGSSWTKRGTLTTDSAGDYSALLNAASGQFLVRVRQPQVGGVDAVQTYANAQAFSSQESTGTVNNTVRPYCATATANYQLTEPTGGGVKCYGARADGIDPGATSNPLAATGGAAILSRVDMATDQAVVRADFGVTAAGSWGDAPDAYKTTNGQSGPYSNPNRAGQPYLYLGANYRLYTNGQPTTQANGHSSDDGLEFSVPAAAGRPAGPGIPAQGQLMATGQKYSFRAKASGPGAAKAYVKAWISGVNASGGAETTFNQALLGGGSCSARPDDQGYVYCDYTPSGTPSGGLAMVFARLRASTESDVTATQRGPSNSAASPWMPNGEIEDYALGVAGGLVRVNARTLGGVEAFVAVGLGTDNVSSTFPSRTTAGVLTVKDGSFVPSYAVGALKSRAAATTLTTTGVGGLGPTQMNGWTLSNRTENGAPVDTWCEDSATGKGLGAAVDTATGKVVIPAPASGGTLPADITCNLTYAPKADVALSTVTADPSANQAAPLIAGVGTSAVELKVAGAAANSDGTLVPAFPIGAQATFALAPVAGTGATATGASLQYSADGGATWQSADQSFTCDVADSGACDALIRVFARAPGGYALTAAVGGAHVSNAATGETTDTSPVQIYFKASAADQANSFVTVTTTPGQPANHDAPGSDPKDWGKQTITATLRDAGGSPYQDAAAAGALTAAPADGGPEGVYYSQLTGDKGQFACAADLVGGRCVDGVYTLDVYASRAGAKQVTVTHAPPVGTAFPVLEETTGNRSVQAVFTVPGADLGSSVFVFNAPGETVPENDIDDPSDPPDGVGVPHPTGYTFHPAIRVWDAGHNNPVGGARVRFRVEDTCPAVFLENTDKSYEAITSGLGKAQASLRSQVAGACRVWGELYVAGQWTALPGGDANPWTKTAEWQDSSVDLGASYFTVSPDPVVADGKSPGTVTVTLIGENTLPVTTAAGSLAAFGPAGQGIDAGAFTHLSGGVYQATFTGTRAGDKLMTVEVDGKALTVDAGGNELAHMVAGAPAAAKSWLAQTSRTATADGVATLPVRVLANDANGNPAAAGTVVFAIPADVTVDGQAGPGEIEVPVAGGEARVELATKAATVYEVTASVGGTQIMTVKNTAGDTVLASDGVARVTFTPGAPSPGDSRLTIPTAGADGQTTKLVGGSEKHRAEAQVKDANGNLVTGGAAGVAFRYRYTDNSGQAQTGVSAVVPTDASGVAAWAFGSDVATVWGIDARIQGTLADVAGSTAYAGFHAGSFDQAATLASFAVDQAVKKADGIAYAEARMKAQDRYGNAVGGISLGFQLDYSVPDGPLFGDAHTGSKTAAPGVSGEDGWVRARIYSVWPGDFDVRGAYQASLSDARQAHFSNAPASTATSRFAVEPKQGNTAYPDAVADGREAFTATVTLRDPDGALLNAAGATVRLTPQGIEGATARSYPVVSGAAGQDGQAQVDLTSLRAGAWDVTVQVGQDQLGTEADATVKSVPVKFVAGPASAAHSRLVAPQGAAKADGQERSRVTAEVADANGNAVTGEPVAFAVPAGVKALTEAGTWVAGPGTVSIKTSAAAGREGVAVLALTSTAVGSYPVTAQVGGADVKEGSPALALFGNADLSPAASEFAVTSMPAVKTVGTGYHTPRVTLKDVSGNIYTPPVAVTFYYRLQGTAAWTAGPTLTTNAGVALWDTFTVTKAGVYDVRANVPQGQIPDAQTTRTAQFGPGPADPRQSEFWASNGKVAPNDKDTHTAKITVKDSYGNLVKGAAAAFDLPPDGPAHFVTDGCDPEYCVIISSETGEAAVELASAAAVTTHVLGAMGGAVVGGADLIFAAGAPDAAQSSWTVTPTGPLTADGVQAYTAAVQVMDAAGAPVDGGMVDFDVPGAVAVSPAGPYPADAGGVVTVRFTSRIAGYYTVNAKIGSAKIGPADQVIAFRAGEISDNPDMTFLTPPPSAAKADGSGTQVVTATVRDAKGNPVTDAEVRFAVPAGASAVGDSLSRVDANGEARLTLTSTAAGTYEVTAEVRRVGAPDWIAVRGGSPAQVQFEAGPVSLTESWISKTQDGPKTADGLDEYTLRVELKDQYSNPIKVPGTPVTVVFRLTGAAAGAPAVTRAIQTGPDGVATTTFATVKAGAWEATGYIGAGQIVGGSPVPLLFTPDSADAGSSLFEVTQNTVLADGAAKHRATVTAMDANGNPAPTTQVVFGVDGGAPGVAGPDLIPADGRVVTGADGVAYVDITSHEPGSFPVTAEIGGAAVKDSPKLVSFDAGRPDSGRSRYQLTPDTAASPTVQVTASGDPEDSYALTVRVRSAGDILVPDANVRLTGLDTSKVSIVEPSGTAGVTGNPKSNSYGAFTWHLYSATAAVFTGQVQVNTQSNTWENVGAAFTLRFGSGVASPADSWLIAPVGPATADGVTPVEVRAHVRDSNGNDVNAGTVEFSVPAGLTARVRDQDIPGGDGVTAAAAVASGYASVKYTSTVAGPYTVSATTGGSPIAAVKDAQEQAVAATDGQAPVVFTPGAATAGASVLTVPTAVDGATKVADGAQTHLAQVLAQDAQGNAVPGAQVMFRYGADPTRLTERTLPAGPDGVAAVEFASTEAAVYQVLAFVAGDPAQDSPQEAGFVAGPFDPDKTLASFEVQDSAAAATGRHPLWARMRAQDAHGNPVADQTLGFKITAPGHGPVFAPLDSGLTETSGVSGEDGLVTVNIVSQFEGVFPVVGVVGADQTQPKTVTFATDAASPLKSWFEVERSSSNTGDPATADGKDSYLVTVNLRNKDGDPINGLQAVVKVADPATGQVTQNTVTTAPAGGAAGTAEYRVRSTKSGTFAVSVEVGGDQLSQPAAAAPDKTAAVRFVAGAASSATSYLMGPQTGPAKADGKEQQVVAVFARDANSNPVTTGSATLAVPSGTTAVDLPGGAGPVDGPDTVTVPLDAAGVARVAFVSRVKATYSATAKIGPTDVTQGSPARLVFVNADVSAAQSAFTVPSAPAAKTVRRQFHTPRVELFDQTGNAYTDAPVDVTFRWRLQGTSSWGSNSHVTTSSAGVAFWPSWTVAQAGVYEVQAWIASGQVGATLTARFKADEALPDAAQFTSSAGTVVANDGKAAHYAQVLTLDAVTGGNPVGEEPVTFRVDGDARILGADGAGQELVVNTSALGVARIQITDAKVGGETVAVTALVKGVQVGSAQLDFKPGAPDAARSSWTVAPTTAIGPSHLGVAADGADSWKATVTLRDSLGDVVPGAEVVFAPSPGVQVVEAAPRLTNGVGVATATLVSTKAGEHSVRALVGADPIAPDPATVAFVAGPVSPGVSHLEPPASTAVADGQDKLAVGAHVLDAQSNPLAGAEVRFAVPDGTSAVGGAPGPSLFEATTDAAGRAEVVLTSVKAAVYEVTAQVKPDGAAAWTAVEGQSPAAAEFVAGPISTVVSRISRTPDGPLTVGSAGTGYKVRVDLLDAKGNAVKQGQTAIQYRFFLAPLEGQNGPVDPEAYCRQAPDANTQFSSALTDSNGVATVSFLTSKAGPWHGCAFYAGDQIVGGSPVPLAYTAAPAEPSTSQLKVSENLVLADGASAHYAKVWARDAFGNPLSAQDVEFSIEEGVPGVPGPNVKGQAGASATVATCDRTAQDIPAYCLEDGVFQEGLAYVEFTSEEPGTFQVAASIGGAPVGGSPAEVSFTSGPADASKSSWAIDPDTADPVDGADVSVAANGADFYTLTVQARSVSNLPVPAALVRIQGLPSQVAVAGGSLEGATGDPASGNFGAFAWELSSTAKGTYHGQVQLSTGSGWANVGGPFTVRFAAGAGVVANSWLVQPGAGATADGASPVRVEARVVDALGNDSSQGQVEFALPAGVWELGGQPTQAASSVKADVDGGVAAVQLVSRTARAFEVTASLGAAGADQIMTVKDAAGAIARIDGTVELQFEAGAVSGENSALTIPTAGTPTPVGGAKHRAEVRAADAAGNAVAGANVVFSWTAGAVDGPQAAASWTAVSPAVPTDGAGIAAYEFAAPANKAGWIWVKATVDGGSGAQAVGGPQTTPPAAQTVKGARFDAGPVDPAGTPTPVGG